MSYTYTLKDIMEQGISISKQDNDKLVMVLKNLPSWEDL